MLYNNSRIIEYYCTNNSALASIVVASQSVSTRGLCSFEHFLVSNGLFSCFLCAHVTISAIYFTWFWSVYNVAFKCVQTTEHTQYNEESRYSHFH